MKICHSHPSLKESCNYCEFECSDNEGLQCHMIDIHGEIVILHTMGKQVNELSENFGERFASLETFKLEVTNVLKSLFQNQNMMKEELLKNQNQMKNELCLIGKKQPDPENTNHSAKEAPSRNIPEATPNPSGSATSSTGPPPPASMPCPGTLPTRSAQRRRRKTQFLEKPKILYVGDSIAQNADIAFIETETQSRIKTKRSYSSIKDSAARWPLKNTTDVTPIALVETFEEDKFSHLVLSAPSVDITNMNTKNIKDDDDVEAFKQKIAKSCENIFTVAQNAITKHPELKSVLIMEHAPRHDEARIDPTGTKAKLAVYANSTFQTLWDRSEMKDKIVLGKHSLNCREDMVNAWYKDDNTGRFDGIHFNSRRGKEAFTLSVLKMILNALPLKTHKNSFTSSSHVNCPQSERQRAQKQKEMKPNQNIFTIPTSNKFSVLGN